MKFDELPDFAGMTRRDIEDYLIERAMVESPFREELLRNANGLLRKLGMPVGDGMKIRIIEEEPKSFYLVLPRVLSEEISETPEASETSASDFDPIASGQGTGMFRFFRGYA